MSNDDKRFVMQTEEREKIQMPKVAVCIAAYNGMNHLDQQLNSILAQGNVDVTVFVSVDKSSDGTELMVDQFVKRDSRVIGLPHGKVFGGAALNFFRILIEADFSQFDYICFADQDDIWLSNKLSKHIKKAWGSGADAASSNVLAFWPDDRKKLIDKAQPQREMDFLFESAGPGCTFLMTPRLIKAVREQLLNDESPARHVSLHDWLCYAICRASGYKWVIDPEPSVMYRQHDSNVIGANVGFSAKLNRLLKIKAGWYRGEVLKIADVCSRIKPNPQVNDIKKILGTGLYFSQLKLLVYVPQARRKLSDRVLLAFAILLGFL